MADNQPILIKVSNSRQIPLKPEMIIGRQAECDLLLTEGHASRRHARLQLAADGVWIEDLGSANGTYINGARIATRTRLKSGDRLRFDMEEFDFRAPVAPAMDDGRTIFRPQPPREPEAPRAPDAPRATEIGRSPAHRPTVIAPAPSPRPPEAPRAAPRPEFAKTEPGRTEAVRPEPARPAEPARTEMARPAEPVRVAEPPRHVEVPRPEPVRPVAAAVKPAEPPRPVEAARPEPVRPVEAPRPAEAPRAAEAAKPGEVVAAASSGLRRPGAWADPDAMGESGNKTKFIDPEQMKQMMKTAPPAGAVSVASIEGPHLQVVSGSRAGLNIKLTVGESGSKEWTIGSQPEREVQFPDSGVSALHAKIVNEGARWKVLDQMSANGTFVNGKRSNVSYLSPGDRVRFGPVECVFHGKGGASPSSVSHTGGASDSASGTTNNKTLVIGAAAFLGTVIILFVLYKLLM